MNYATVFPSPPAPENPLSELGVWLQSTDTDLTPFRSVAGKAIATAAGIGAFDDSAALQAGYAANVAAEIRCGVFKDPTLNPLATHEDELLFRSSVGSGITSQYECLYAFQGTVQGVRWFNNAGNQDFAFLTSIAGLESISRQFVTGDTIIARIVGDCLELSAIGFDGTKYFLAFYKDTNIAAAGLQGIGGFTRVADGGDPAKFCFTSATISDQFQQEQVFEDVFGRANQNPLGAPYSTPSGVDALQLIGNMIGTTVVDTDSMARYVGQVADVDHWAEVTVGVVGARDFGIALCAQPNGDAIVTTNALVSDIQLYTRIGGSFGLVGSVAGTLQVGDRLRGRRFGGDIIISLNDVDIMTAEVINPQLLGGQPGMFMFDSTSRISRFRAGNMTAVFPTPPPSDGGGVEGVLEGTSVEGTTVEGDSIYRQVA